MSAEHQVGFIKTYIYIYYINYKVPGYFAHTWTIRLGKRSDKMGPWKIVAIMYILHSRDTFIFVCPGDL